MAEDPALSPARAFTIKKSPTGVVHVRAMTRQRLFQDTIQALAVVWCMHEGHLEEDPKAWEQAKACILQLAELDDA